MPISLVQAWDELGHQQSAALAFEQLTREEQHYWIDVLRHHPRFEQDFLSAMPAALKAASQSEQQRWLFARAGYWPDVARGLPETARRQFNRPNWHWIDGRWVRSDAPRQGNVYLDSMPRPDIQGPNDQRIRQLNLSDNVMTALITAATTLEKPLPSHNAEQRADMAVALCWYLHLGADIHQPLHAGALYNETHLPEGDRGGNLIRLTSRSNLHSRWDQALRGSRRDELLSSFEQLDAQQVGTDFSPGTWLRESREILHTAVYTDAVKAQILATPANADDIRVELQDDYHSAMQSIALQRIALSAARLAAHLKTLTQSAHSE